MMEKLLKDYLHLYLGCKVRYPDTDDVLVTATLTGVTSEGVETTYLRKKRGVSGDTLSWKPNGCHNSDATNLRPLLRPLSDMTDEELIGYITIVDPKRTEFPRSEVLSVLQDVKEGGIDALDFDYQPAHICFEACRYLLSRGFDLFGLIDQGLAIDASDINQ